jgi:hypothetical protein
VTFGNFAVLVAGVVRLLPEHLDLFTACTGGAGIGGVLGGLIAVLMDEDIATWGVVGAALGLFFGAILAILQAPGIHS